MVCRGEQSWEGSRFIRSVGGTILTESSFLSFVLPPITSESNPASTSYVSNLDRISLFSVHSTGILHLTSSSVALRPRE